MSRVGKALTILSAISAAPLQQLLCQSGFPLPNNALCPKRDMGRMARAPVWRTEKAGRTQGVR